MTTKKAEFRYTWESFLEITRKRKWLNFHSCASLWKRLTWQRKCWIFAVHDRALRYQHENGNGGISIDVQAFGSDWHDTKMAEFSLYMTELFGSYTKRKWLNFHRRAGVWKWLTWQQKCLNFRYTWQSLLEVTRKWKWLNFHRRAGVWKWLTRQRKYWIYPIPEFW